MLLEKYDDIEVKIKFISLELKNIYFNDISDIRIQEYGIKLISFLLYKYIEKKYKSTDIISFYGVDKNKNKILLKYNEIFSSDDIVMFTLITQNISLYLQEIDSDELDFNILINKFKNSFIKEMKEYFYELYNENLSNIICYELCFCFILIIFFIKKVIKNANEYVLTLNNQILKYKKEV